MRLGIKFGTYFSSAAFMNGNTLITVKDPLTSRLSIPSSIFVKPQGQVLVGTAADTNRLQDPARYSQGFKRALDQGHPLLLGTNLFWPEELVAQVLMKIKHDADGQMKILGKPTFTGAVLTIPATYSQYKRDLMLKAATQAGFGQEELTLLEEPIAAALYYAHQSNVPSGEILLVYDLGSSRFDTALLQKRGDDFVYLALPAGIELCGGEDFDHEIMQDLVRQHPELQEVLQGVRRDSASLAAGIIIQENCNYLKHELNLKDDAGFSIVVPGTEDVIEYTLTREAFQEMIAPFIQETIACCHQMCQQAQVKIEQINHILLVGGSCQIPYVQQVLSNTFSRRIIATFDLELVLCEGAALHAAQLEKPVISKPDPKKALGIFYSYSHKDEKLMKKLETHLSLFKQQGYITNWYDRKIDAGQEWTNEIDDHLKTADIILLLVSPDFLASDYCYGIEMKRALERHESGDARVIPIILRAVSWQGAPFGKLQVLPTDAKPVTSRNWHNQDEAFFDIAEGVRKILERMRKSV